MRFVVSGALMVGVTQWGQPVDILLAALGCLLVAVGLMMAANRSGYVTFIVGPRTVLLLAGVVGVFGYWVLRGSH